MEADLFQQIFDVLESGSTKLHVPIRYGSPITKIIWSSFDYMCGPELRFVWQPQYAEPLLSLPEEQIDDSSSDRITSSSKTNDELQYDDTIGMTTSYDLEESAQNKMCISSTSWLQKNNELELLSDQAAGTSTLKSSSVDNTTITLNNGAQDPHDDDDNNAITDDEHSSYTNVSDSPKEDEGNDEEALKNTAMITSCVDSGIAGTISMHSDLSTCRSPKPTNSIAVPYEPIDEIASSCSDQSDYGIAEEDRADCCSNNLTNSDDSEHLIDCVGKHATASFLNASSNVLGLSMLGASLDFSASINEETESKTLQQLNTDDKKPDGGGQLLQDEEFVAKFVLAEQIFSIQFDSNPIVPKISVVPNRRLLLCSYLFCARNDSKSMVALSVVLNEDAEEWFYAREKVFEEIFTDIIPRFKASLLAEEDSDVICRITADFTDFFNLWGTLERFPLLDSSSLWKIDLSKTYLMDDYMDKEDLRFVYKAISGCLACQGYAVLIGNDVTAVEKIMATLSLFLQPFQRLLCMKAHSFHYNPYLRLQSLKKCDAEELYMSAAESHWPVCFVDVERKWVHVSGNYFEHRDRKQAFALYQLVQIFKDAGAELEMNEESASRRAPIISPLPFEVDPYISNMLDAFFLLGQDPIERLTFIDHLHMNLDYKAQAFVQTVKEMSEPAKNFKENFVSSRYSLHGARKLLNLSAETTFSIILARADALTNSFAEFIYQTVKSHR